MSVHEYDTLAELVANLGPIELKLYNEFGADDYMHLMHMWAAIAQDKFEEFCEEYDLDEIEYISEISHRANQIVHMCGDKNKLVH